MLDDETGLPYVTTILRSKLQRILHDEIDQDINIYRGEQFTVKTTRQDTHGAYTQLESGLWKGPLRSRYRGRRR